ncbi:UDP-glycosyltransferase UGT5 [Helicoverpa armigera]|uniref:UDP-glycosyltransferase UGT5 n=1 Tax=Helicoverpa armigera TaxID=29058 RepID=UPI0030838F85
MFIALILLFLSCSTNDAAKILAVFPAPSISHQVVFRPLTQELARRGHEVTVITPDPAFPKGEAPANLTEIDVHFSYESLKEFHKATSSGDGDIVNQFKLVLELLNKVFEDQMKFGEVQRILKEGKFDLLLVEAMARPALALAHVFKVPVIQISSAGPMNFNVVNFGTAWHPLLYPLYFSQRIYNLTTYEKITELWNFYKQDGLLKSLEDYENTMNQRLFGRDVPTVAELTNNVEMLFLNVHPLWEDNRPVPPSVIYMGGLHQKPEKDLPKDLKTYLDSSKNGVIYISFGTNVKPSLLPPEKVQILVKVFSELPYDVLWKWDKDELPGRSSNIKISKWLPQSDLLRHPKIKMFITQGGLQSTDEAITAGVPLIGVPMLGDQWYNVEKYVHHEIGIKIDLKSLTEKDFKEAINKIINDKRYRQNIQKLGSLMRDQPMTPLERAVWWTEHVLRHGGARHLRSPAANMSWTQFLELELVLIVLAVAQSCLILMLVLIKCLWKYSSSKQEPKKIKKR